jgi:hypothetical protein
MVLDPRILVSWDGSGAFTGPHDDVTHDVAADPGWTADEGRDSAQSLAPPKVSAGSFELFNHTGKYSQQRGDSPVYQRVLPGRPVAYRVQYGAVDAYDTAGSYDAQDPYDGVGTWDLGVQLIDEISQTTAWGARRVAIQTIGREVVLTDSVVSVPLQTAIRTDQAVTLLLDACGWPADKRIIGLGDTILSYWWCDERHPWDAMLDLLGAEGPGTYYVDRSGVFHWEGRNYRTIEPRAAISQATYYDRLQAGGLWFSELSYDPGYRNLYNRATYQTTRRAPIAHGPIWEYGATLTLAANETRTLIARPSELFTDAHHPQPTTDYVVTAGSATALCTSQSGFVAFIEVTAGPSGATIIGPGTTKGLQLRAASLPVVSETTAVNSVDAAASIAMFSPIPGANIPITLTVPGWADIEPVMAQAVCDAWVSRYSEARPVLTFALRNTDNAHVFEVLSRQPSDRVTLVESNTGLNNDAWINSMELSIRGGRAATLTIGAELCSMLAGAVWDSPAALWDDPNTLWGV